VVFYLGKAFPAKYNDGAFMSFHGSWNRKPTEQGFLVAFVPFIDGKPEGNYEEFTIRFAGPEPPADPTKAA
jgi:glucose/arabinose dehydrogenase